MPKLMFATLEMADENNDGSTVTLYFDSSPNNETKFYQQLKMICADGDKVGHLPLRVDVYNEFFEWYSDPTPLSEEAGWYRVQCYPAH